MFYHRIASQFFNRPLLLAPAAAEAIGSFLFSRIAAGSRSGASGDAGAAAHEAFPAQRREDGALEIHSVRASRFYADTPLDDTGRPMPFGRTADGRAIITIIGETVNRGAWIGASSGLVSDEAIKYQLARAVADPKTSEIILDIESPGGEAVGAMEAAAAVRAVRQSKPVTALVNGMAASAAYALASGAKRIVTLPSGIAGSIGVVMMHLDYSKFLREEGIKPSLIYAGAHKVEGNPFESLPDEVRAEYQKEVDGFYAQSVETVRAGRARLSAETVRATEARTFVGQEAINAGLADEIGPLEDVLGESPRSVVLRDQLEETKPMQIEQKAQPRAMIPPVMASKASGAKSREALIAEFKAGADLQREFLSVESFVAYVPAEADGKIKICTPRVVRAGRR